MTRRALAALTCAGLIGGVALLVVSWGSSLAERPQDFGWRDVPAFSMGGDLKVYWNVGDGSKGEAAKNAYARGFWPITLIDPYANRAGGGKDHIVRFLREGNNASNPWAPPPYFERVIRGDIARSVNHGVIVQDIEFHFEQDAAKAWDDPVVRAASGETTREAFAAAYLAEWAKWFIRPLQWTREIFPGAKVGLYGPQPFRRDYWGIAGKSAHQIDGTHASDDLLWRHIDPHVDFYVASIYVFYDRPDSVFYMAANVEENYLRTRALGDKPVYAYTWLRFHDSNRWLKGQELPPYLVEAMAIVPYFSGAKGVVLWGHEPQVKAGTHQPYAQLPHFVRSLERVATLSERIARGRLLIEQPAHVAWNTRVPLVRTVMINDEECVIMAVNPWQGEIERTWHRIQCGRLEAQIVMEGRRTTLAVLNKEGVRAY